ncbi:MAG: iron-containing alcohol dehydrogenase [Candidatus Ventricola sp.]
MLTQYQLKMPRAVYCGADVLSKITEIIRETGAKKVIILTDRGIEAAGLLGLVEEAVKASGAAYSVLDGIEAEPTYMAVQGIIDQCRQIGADLVLACGGGSVMDTAKLASVLMTDEYDIRDLLDAPGRAKKCIPSILVPTTAGTGSEATPNAIVAVPEKMLKVGIVNDSMIADYAVLDARMIRNLPRSIAAATGVDALAHAIECYTSNKANPISDTFALEALDMILTHIEAACDGADQMEAKSSMLLAAFYAGVAITASGTTAVHALSYPLGGKYHIAHGVSNAMLLVPVMKFNEPLCRDRLAKAYDRCCHDDSRCQTAEEKSAWIIRRLDEIVRHLDIPTSLSRDFHVPREDLDGLVEAGMQVTRLLNNNIRRLTAEDARKIYLEVL